MVIVWLQTKICSVAHDILALFALGLLLGAIEKIGRSQKGLCLDCQSMFFRNDQVTVDFRACWQRTVVFLPTGSY